MEIKRKSFNFNTSEREQNVAFIFLEKIRYQQTKFVTKLIMDFLSDNGLTINDPYDVIKDACQSYIEGKEVTKKPIAQKDVVLEKLDNIENLLLEMNDKTAEDKKVQTEPSEIKTPDAVKVDDKATETELDDEDSAPLGNMLSSFKSMAER